MKICLCYICVTNGQRTSEHISKFTASYHLFPPDYEHDTLIICNGGPITTEQVLMFSGMTVQMWPRKQDEGWDISAYIDAAKGPCAGYDMMLCLGESNYFHHRGWLKRLADAWDRLGPGMYGPYATNVVRTHLQTTAFASPPALLANYPARVTCRRDRYQFEHGEQAFWRRCEKQHVPVRLVTWDGEWTWRFWRKPPNIIWRGDQSNCLMWCNHSDAYRNADAGRKAKWEASANRPPK